MIIQFAALQAELFLEQRIQHDGGRAGILGPADGIDFFRQRPAGGNDERAAQFHSEIRGAQVHNSFHFRSGSSVMVALVQAAGAGDAGAGAAGAGCVSGAILRAARYS